MELEKPVLACPGALRRSALEIIPENTSGDPLLGAVRPLFALIVACMFQRLSVRAQLVPGIFQFESASLGLYLLRVY